MLTNGDPSNNIGNTVNQNPITLKTDPSCSARTGHISDVTVGSVFLLGDGMGKRIDLTGKKYGRLVCVQPLYPNSSGVMVWLCECECGKIIRALINSLRSGNTKSCGCLQKETAKKGCEEKNFSHGFGNDNNGIYRSWTHLKGRCLNHKDKSYKDYGGRGITVCDEWLEFENFLRDMGPTFIHGLTIERVDNNGNYEPSNCTWIPKSEQSKNRRNTIQNRPVYIGG